MHFKDWLAREGPGPERSHPSVLSDHELVTYLFRDPDFAVRVWSRVALGDLIGRSADEVARTAEIPKARAEQLVAAVELGRRALTRTNGQARPAIRTAEDVCRVAVGLRGLPHEEMHVLLLDGRHRLMSMTQVARGGVASTPVDPKEVFGPAMRSRASAIVLVHNHPTGDPSPSPEDLDLTRRIVEGAGVLGLRVVDHVIIGDGSWASLHDLGHLP